MEPAAVLVGTFEIEIGRPFQVRPLLKAEGMGGARIEPHIQNVAHLLPLKNIVIGAEEALGSAAQYAGRGALPV